MHHFVSLIRLLKAKICISMLYFTIIYQILLRKILLLFMRALHDEK